MTNMISYLFDIIIILFVAPFILRLVCHLIAEGVDSAKWIYRRIRE